MTETRKEEFTNLLAANLPMLRKACEMSQTRFSELTGISRSALSVIENKKSMTWSQFLSVITVLDFHPNVKKHVAAIGIDYDELNDFLSGNGRREDARHDK